MKYLKMIGLAVVAAAALMAFLGAGTASATSLYVEGKQATTAVTIEATLKPGTSAILKDKNGTTNDTCTESTVEGTTEAPFTGGATVSGPVNTLHFNGCTHTTHVIKPGRLSVSWISGTENGTVTSSGAEVTVKSTVFGTSAVCSTGAGTDIGVLTGATSGNATMDISTSALDCGPLGASSWTGTYLVTKPSGLHVTE